MINEAFEILHLQERKITTPLFHNAREAFIGQAYGHKFHSKYLVIDSQKQMDDSLFKQGNICPVFIYNNKSYIFQEGESLYAYFLSKKDTDIVLCEEEIWKLLSQISRALLLLREAGYNHRHLKEYAIRRVSPDIFRLIFHPTMNTAQQLIRQERYRWFQFYLAPEQLTDLAQQQSNSCVFSLGAMIINLMNPLDFRRDIYSKREYVLNRTVLQEKITNASMIYSPKIMEIAKKMVAESFETRLSLEQLILVVNQVNPFEKKMQMTTNIKSIVNQKLSKSKEKANSPPTHPRKPSKEAHHNQKYYHKVINFERGTFGGHIENDQDQSEEEISKERQARNVATVSMKKDKVLTKADSELVNKFQQRPSQRSYSEYIDTIKKGNKDSPQSKGSEEEETKAQSGKVKINISIFNSKESSKDLKVQGYNEYMKKQNLKKTTFPRKQPSSNSQTLYNDYDEDERGEREERDETEERVERDERDEREKEPQSIKKRNYISLNGFSSRQADISVESNNIESSVRDFELKINDKKLQLAECLEEPSFLARRLGYQGVWVNGNVYYGEFKNGRRNGMALQVFQNSEYYYGNYKDDMFHGQGFYFWNNNEHFLGTFEAGAKKEGSWLGKNKYIGQIKENKRHGIGKYTYSNGSMYEGQWFLGKRHGSGIVTEPSGEKFIGTFKMGRKWGHGSYLVNKCRVSGVWDGEAAVGPCEIVYQDGRVYKGFINADFEMHGEGELSFSTGSVCKGEFSHDDFIFGQMLYRNGQHYMGHAKDMRRHGKGTYTYIGGKQVTGEWRDNVLVSDE